MRRVAGCAAASAVVAAALSFGSGTAVAATPDLSAPASQGPAASSDGGSGGDVCTRIPTSLRDLLCPSAGDDEETSSGGSATSGSGATSYSTTSGTTGTTGTTATTPPSGTAPSGTAGAPGSSGSTVGGVVSNFLIWLAGLFRSVGL